MKPVAHEINMDGLVGPTHNYSGLAYGNLASMENKARASNPKEAALQGLRKMKLLLEMGMKQAVIPPHERPALKTLWEAGYRGKDVKVLERAKKANPDLFLACCSASGMWVANAATVSPSADTSDGRVHITPANLTSQFHRSIEVPFTSAVLSKLFNNPDHFAHHFPLGKDWLSSDEGAANHVRLCPSHGDAGIELFVFGRENGDETATKYPARQAKEASMAIARSHQLDEKRTLFVQQHPNAIDQGVFHNDVICVSNEHTLLLHEGAFVKGHESITDIADTYRKNYNENLSVIEVSSNELSISDALSCYLFNSQLVSLQDGKQCLIAPIECQWSDVARPCIENIIKADNPISQVCYVDLTQSMHNGGGPACLRLRVVVTEAELQHVHGGVMLTAELYDRLVNWVEEHYREHLTLDDLCDGDLIDESHHALDELTSILQLGSIYSFQ